MRLVNVGKRDERLQLRKLDAAFSPNAPIPIYDTCPETFYAQQAIAFSVASHPTQEEEEDNASAGISSSQIATAAAVIGREFASLSLSLFIEIDHNSNYHNRLETLFFLLLGVAMKASLQLRDDRSPLVRAKLPLTALGLPFLSAFSAGDPSDLRVDLSTASHAGPVVRLSYRPNDLRSPFSLALKMGIGDLGSPFAAPMTMCVEFSPLARGGGPFFSIVFKPRLGDFSLKKSIRSGSGPPTPLGNHGSIATENGFHDGKKANGIVPTVALDGGAQRLLSGAELRASSILPLRRGTALRFRWGVRLPLELGTPFNDYPKSGDRMSFRRLPQLVMSKISIEHMIEDDKVRKQKNDATSREAGEVAEWSSAKLQLEALRAENVIMRRDVRELCDEVFSKSKVAPSSSAADVRDWRNMERGRKIESKQPPAPPAAAERKDRRFDVKPPATSVKTQGEDVNEELKKALMAATSGAKRVESPRSSSVELDRVSLWLPPASPLVGTPARFLAASSIAHPLPSHLAPPSTGNTSPREEASFTLELSEKNSSLSSDSLSFYLIGYL
ncbi:hypothetical protein Cni_G06824 [Canna indica]|uniref:Uncharacterized protein n=1 Tax=Canna indica TaxID=4628 RepID=A0AAQ3JZB3_9LILI|nr:hypothetical protein Cni_G06824 [Canna indica]